VRRAIRLLLIVLALAPSTPSEAARRPSHRTAGRKPMRRAPARVMVEKQVPAVKGGQPNVQAAGALVVDLESGEELYKRNADQARPIASISKLAAALVLVDHHVDLDGQTTMTRVDVDVARGGATSRLLEGMTLSNRDLLHAALLGSDNRAVSALGRSVGLAATPFAEAMNKKVAALGLRHTHFREPTGLSPENVSTPRELVTLLRTAMADAVLGPILRTCEYDAHPVARAPIHYVNTHRPAHRANTDVLGGKTGFNDKARYCLVIANRIDGRDYVMAFLGTEGKLTRFGDAARVGDWIVSRRPKAPPPALAAPPAALASPAAITPAPITPAVEIAKPVEGNRI
jgi:serine-type D-Ala-D-Ala endopeptidase (penicillin-binding protein 7)